MSARKYDSAIAALQGVKSQTANLDKKYSTITNSLEEKLGKLSGTIDRQDQSLYRVECALDETQQYLRRDCLEINDVPISSYENPNQLVKEVGSLAGIEIDDRHIAVAHMLPDSKNVKNRLIVKFIQRDKREELYKNRKNLVGKNISHLPSVEDGNGKIFINESLTSYRKRLLGRIREYKRKNNANYLWTNNGKIMLKDKCHTWPFLVCFYSICFVFMVFSIFIRVMVPRIQTTASGNVCACVRLAGKHLLTGNRNGRKPF